jgi:hypothetical protein
MSMERARVMLAAFGREDVRCRRTTSKGSNVGRAETSATGGRQSIEQPVCCSFVPITHTWVS